MNKIIIIFTLLLTACSSISSFDQSVYKTKKEFLLKNEDYRQLISVIKEHIKKNDIPQLELSIDLSNAYYLNGQYDFAMKELLSKFNIKSCDKKVIDIATNIYKKTADNNGFKNILHLCPLGDLSTNSQINIASYYIVNNKLTLAKKLLLPIVINKNLDNKTYPLLAIIYYKQGDADRALSLLYSLPSTESINNLIEYIGKES